MKGLRDDLGAKKNGKNRIQYKVIETRDNPTLLRPEIRPAGL
jgi:hypothetical protein